MNTLITNPDQCTPWFDSRLFDPVRPGLYEVRRTPTGRIVLAHWHTVFGWSWARQSSFFSSSAIAEWRGLRTDWRNAITWDQRDDEIWTCADGRRIPVDAMDPGHMRSVLKMLLRLARKAEVGRAIRVMAEQAAAMRSGAC